MRPEFDAVARETAAELASSPHDSDRVRRILAALPERIASHLGPHGWDWNGFYVLDPSGILRLGPAHGPPVCAELSPSNAPAGPLPPPFTSGMCFDGLVLNQTLYASRSTDPSGRPGPWPGYVSCDAESGLDTVAGIVSPLRDPGGRPIAVWDLDASRPLATGDVRFVDVFFASLSRALALSPADFLKGA